MHLRKKVIALFIFALLIVLSAACSSAPTASAFSATILSSSSPQETITTAPTFVPSEMETLISPTSDSATASPLPDVTEDVEDGPTEPPAVPDYDIPDIKKAGLTEEQFQKIKLLLYGALNVNQPFQSASALKTAQLLNFAENIIDYGADLLGMEFQDTYSKDDVENIINSAFAVHYKAKNGDASGDTVSYQNGRFTMQANGGDPRSYTSVYSITRSSQGQLKILFDSCVVANVGNLDYEGKMQAVLKEDGNSIFGYRLLSFTKLQVHKPLFKTAIASASLPDMGAKSFKPMNVLDGKMNTAWVIPKGIGQWIMLSSGSQQTVTGMMLWDGDRSGDEQYYDMGKPSKIKLEFSDGTILEETIDVANTADDWQWIPFGREIRTKEIKITILTVSEYAQSDDVYISEIELQ